MSANEDAELIEVEAIFGRLMAFENDLITDHIIKFGAHTRVELAFLLSVVSPGDFVFDLGAHIGTFAIPLAQKVGAEGRLLAVEGLPGNFAVLDKNLARAARCAETRTLNALVAPCGRYQAHTPPGNTGGTLFLPGPVAGAAAETETVTVDELCRRYFTPRIIKIDIEGCEALALAGSQLLRDEHPIIYAEVRRHLLTRQGTSIDMLNALFRDNGYRLFRNIGDRNAAHDRFVTTELANLTDGGHGFDVMAIHRNDRRLGPVLNSIGGQRQ